MSNYVLSYPFTRDNLSDRKRRWNRGFESHPFRHRIYRRIPNAKGTSLKPDACGSFEVITAERQRIEPGKVIVTALAGLFFLICTWTSYSRWANFQYRSFDLAYYVQAIWQLIHGRLC